VILNALYNKTYWIDFIQTGFSMGMIMEKLPLMLFIVVLAATTWLSFQKKLSLIPVMGLLSCLFLMTRLGHTNWLRFLIWLGIGLIVYFAFSRRNSRLNSNLTANTRGIQER
jgi:hypothetical protein